MHVGNKIVMEENEAYSILYQPPQEPAAVSADEPVYETVNELFL